MNNKKVMKVLAQRLASVFLLLSLSQGISYASIFDDAMQGNLAQLNKLDDKSLKKTDGYGFSLLDYARDTDQKELVKYLLSKKIDSGIDGKLVQQVQFWMSILGFQVDNFKGVNNANMKQNILTYQKQNGLAETGVIRPSWIIGLEFAAIKNLQQRLVNNGASLDVNGKLDAATKTALKKFQADKKLAQSGQLSELTVVQLKEIKLNSVDVKSTVAQESQSSKVEVSSTVLPDIKAQENIENNAKDSVESSFLLSKDAKEGKTLDIQAWLAIMGVPAGTLDGDMGPDTRENIKSYQKSIGKKPTGILSADWESVLENKVRKKVQTKLKTLNFYQGKEDGINGSATINAIKAFEKKQNLKVTGTLNAITLVELLNFGVLENSANIVETEAVKSSEKDTLKSTVAGDGQKAEALDNEEDEAAKVPVVAIETEDLSEPSLDSNAEVEKIENTKKADVDNKKPQKHLRSYRITGDNNLLLTQLKLAYLGHYSAVADGKKGKSTDNAIIEFAKSSNLKSKTLDKTTLAELDKKVISKFQENLLKTGKIKDQPTGAMGNKTRKSLSDLRVKKGVSAGSDLNVTSLLAMIDDLDQSRFAKQYAKQEKELLMAKAQIQEGQRYLISLGYLAGNSTGQLDKGTQKAISNFRAKEGLKRSDNLDAALIANLKKASIRKMQNGLNSIGYAVKATGQLDANTQKAIKEYQKKYKVKGSGFSLDLVAQIDKTVREREIVKNRRAPSKLLVNSRNLDKLPKSSTNTANISQVPRNNLSSDVDNSINDSEETTSSDVIIVTRGSSSNSSVTSDSKAQIPNLSNKAETASLSSSGDMIRGEPNNTIKGQMKILKNDAGSTVGCRIGAITVSTEWCQTKQENDQCSVLYRNGRVLSVRCK